jgi:ankyrin repeat protein
MLLTKCKGINIDAKNNLGFTPLMKAALQGRTKSAKLLLFAGKSSSNIELFRVSL